MRSLLSSVSFNIISTLDVHQHLLNFASTMIPYIERTRHGLWHDLDDWFVFLMFYNIEGSRFFFVFIFPNALLVRKPWRKVLRHWEWILVASGHSWNSWLFPLFNDQIFNSLRTLSWGWLSIVNFLLLADSLYETVWQDTLLSVESKIIGFFLEPFWKFDLFDWIGEVLKDGWNADHFLYLGTESLKIVSPIKDVLDVDVFFVEILIFSPHGKIFFLNFWISIKYLSRNCTFCNWFICREGWNDEIACEACFSLDDFWAQKLSQSFRTADSNTFRLAIIFDVFA